MKIHFGIWSWSSKVQFFCCCFFKKRQNFTTFYSNISKWTWVMKDLITGGEKEFNSSLGVLMIYIPQKHWFWAFFAPNKIFGGSLWPNLQTGEIIIQTCVREFKSTERCFFREYDFQLQDAHLLWLWDKWNFEKWKFLWCFFRHDTLKSKSDGYS